MRVFVCCSLPAMLELAALAEGHRGAGDRVAEVSKPVRARSVRPAW